MTLLHLVDNYSMTLVLVLSQPLDNLINDPAGVAGHHSPRLVQEVRPGVGEEHQVRVQVDQVGTGIISLAALGQILEVQTCVGLRRHRHLVSTKFSKSERAIQTPECWFTFYLVWVESGVSGHCLPSLGVGSQLSHQARERSAVSLVLRTQHQHTNIQQSSLGPMS